MIKFPYLSRSRVLLAANLLLKVKLVDLSSLKIGRTTGMLGVRYMCLKHQSLMFIYAQDVEIHHLETARQLEFNNITVVAQGPLRAAVKAEVRYGQSLITVTVRMLTDSVVN
jgi:hypothetical protein